MSWNEQEFKPIKEAEFDLFARWLALPSALRQPGTQGELADELKINQDLLSAWKHTDELWSLVDKHRRAWVRESTADVIESLLKRIKKTGDPVSVKLFMELFEKFVQKVEVAHQFSPEERKRWNDTFVEFVKSRGIPQPKTASRS